MKSGLPRGVAAHAVYGLLAVLAGFALVIAGIIVQLMILGAIGFLMMVAGAHWFLNGFRSRHESG